MSEHTDLYDVIPEDDFNSLLDDDANSVSPEENKKTELPAMVASARSGMRSESFSKLYIDAKAEFEIKTAKEINDEVRNEYQNYLDQYTLQNTTEAIQEMPMEEAIEYGVAADEANRELKKDSEVTHVVANSIALLHGKNPVEKNEIVLSTAVELFKRKFVDRSTLDTVRDYAGLLAPDIILDSFQLTGELSFTGDNIKDMSATFNALPHEEQISVIPMLLDMVIDAEDDNKIKTARTLLSVIDTNQSAKSLARFMESIVEAATLLPAGTLATKVIKSLKSANSAKTLSKLGDTGNSAEISVRVLADDTSTVADDVGVDQFTASRNASPFKAKDLGEDLADIEPGVTSGTHVDIQEKLAKINQERVVNQEILDATASRSTFLDSSILNDAQKKKFREKKMNTLEEFLDSQRAEGVIIDDAKITHKGNDSFTVEYFMRDGDTGGKVKQTFEYTLDSSNHWNIDSMGTLDGKIGAANTKFNQMEGVFNEKGLLVGEDTVGEVTSLGFGVDVVQNDINKLLSDSWKPLGKGITPASKDSRRRMNAVLNTGTDNDVVYSAEHAIYEGIDTPEGRVNLTVEEFGVYQKTRDILDTLGVMKSSDHAIGLRAQGFRELELQNGNKYPARTFELDKIPMDDIDNINVISFTSDEGVELLGRDIDFGELYKRGFTLVKSKPNGRFSWGEGEFDFAIVKTAELRDVGDKILRTRPGYSPIHYKNANYFVKKKVEKPVNGKMVQTEITVARFERKADADAYAKENGSEYGVKHDRELTPSELEEESLRTYGGMYTSSRAQHDIVLGKGVVRTNALEAISRYSDNVTQQFPLSKWRIRMQDTWLNTYNKFIDTPNDFFSPIKKEFEFTKVGLQSESIRDWINDQLRIPTKQEKKWAAKSTMLAEWMEGVPLLDRGIQGVSVRSTVYNMGHKDPFAALRSAAFHGLLGWGNPLQIWMQAQGANIALAIDPIGAAKHLGQLIPLNSAIFLNGNKKAIAITAKSAGMKPEELTDLLDAFNRTGLGKSITNTAYHNDIKRSYGMTSKMFRKAAQTGRIPFNIGEMFTRQFSWLTARSRYKDRNPGADMNSLEAQKQVMNDTLKFMLNMSRSNRAYWQKGVWSLPGQFMQPFMRFYENMWVNGLRGSTGNFTAGEKSRIAAGNLMLYGAGGIGIGSLILGAGEDLAGIEVTDPRSKELDILINDGITGLYTNWIFGEPAEIGSRGSLLNGPLEFIHRIMVDNQSIPKAAFGAGGELPRRAFASINNISDILSDTTEVEWTPDIFMSIGDEVLDTVSSWRNLSKALMWKRTGLITDTRGNTLFKFDSNTDQGLFWMQALGIEPKKIADLRNLKNYNRAKKQLTQDMKVTYKKFLLSYLVKVGDGTITDKDKLNFRRKKAFIAKQLLADEFQKMQQDVADEFAHPQARTDKLIRDALIKAIRTGESSQGLESISGNTLLRRDK